MPPFLCDIGLTENFDTAGQGWNDLFGVIFKMVEHAIFTKPHLQPIFHGLYMDIAGTVFDRPKDN